MFYLSYCLILNTDTDNIYIHTNRWTVCHNQASNQARNYILVVLHIEKRKLYVRNIDLIFFLFIGLCAKHEGMGLLSCIKNRQYKCYIGQMVDIWEQKYLTVLNRWVTFVGTYNKTLLFLCGFFYDKYIRRNWLEK